MSKWIGSAHFINRTGLMMHDKEHCFEWSLSTGYTHDGDTVARSKSGFVEYIMEVFLNEFVCLDEDLKEYIQAEEKEKEYWTTDGPVRGHCGHKHRTEAAAERCLAKDQRGCHSQGGYSDRVVIHCTD